MSSLSTRPEKLLLEAQTWVALTCPFLGFPERSEVSWPERWVVPISAPAGWGPSRARGRSVGMGWARRSPQFLPHQPSASCSSEPSFLGGHGIVPAGAAGATRAPAKSRDVCGTPQARGHRPGSPWELQVLLSAEQCRRVPFARALIAMRGSATLYPNQAVILKLGGCVLASCAQNQEFQVSSKSDKGESHLPLNRWKRLLPEWWAGFAARHFWDTACPFSSQRACECTTHRCLICMA